MATVKNYHQKKNWCLRVRPYSNNSEQLVLAKFYLDHGKKKEGKSVPEEVLEESKHMTKPNKKQYRTTILEVQRILKTL